MLAALESKKALVGTKHLFFGSNVSDSDYISHTVATFSSLKYILVLVKSMKFVLRCETIAKDRKF